MEHLNILLKYLLIFKHIYSLLLKQCKIISVMLFTVSTAASGSWSVPATLAPLPETVASNQLPLPLAFNVGQHLEVLGSVPIAVPTGIANFGPSISIDYNSKLTHIYPAEVTKPDCFYEMIWNGVTYKGSFSTDKRDRCIWLAAEYSHYESIHVKYALNNEGNSLFRNNIHIGHCYKKPSVSTNEHDWNPVNMGFHACLVSHINGPRGHNEVYKWAEHALAPNELEQRPIDNGVMTDQHWSLSGVPFIQKCSHYVEAFEPPSLESFPNQLCLVNGNTETRIVNVHPNKSNPMINGATGHYKLRNQDDTTVNHINIEYNVGNPDLPSRAATITIKDTITGLTQVFKEQKDSTGFHFITNFFTIDEQYVSPYVDNKITYEWESYSSLHIQQGYQIKTIKYGYLGNEHRNAIEFEWFKNQDQPDKQRPTGYPKSITVHSNTPVSGVSTSSLETLYKYHLTPGHMTKNGQPVPESGYIYDPMTELHCEYQASKIGFDNRGPLTKLFELLFSQRDNPFNSKILNDIANKNTNKLHKIRNCGNAQHPPANPLLIDYRHISRIAKTTGLEAPNSSSPSHQIVHFNYDKNCNYIKGCLNSYTNGNTISPSQDNRAPSFITVQLIDDFPNELSVVTKDQEKYVNSIQFKGSEPLDHPSFTFNLPAYQKIEYVEWEDEAHKHISLNKETTYIGYLPTAIETQTRKNNTNVTKTITSIDYNDDKLMTKHTTSHFVIVGSRDIEQSQSTSFVKYKTLDLPGASSTIPPFWLKINVPERITTYEKIDNQYVAGIPHPPLTPPQFNVTERRLTYHEDNEHNNFAALRFDEKYFCQKSRLPNTIAFELEGCADNNMIGSHSFRKTTNPTTYIHVNKNNMQRTKTILNQHGMVSSVISEDHSKGSQEILNSKLRSTEIKYQYQPGRYWQLKKIIYPLAHGQPESERFTQEFLYMNSFGQYMTVRDKRGNKQITSTRYLLDPLTFQVNNTKIYDGDSKKISDTSTHHSNIRAQNGSAVTFTDNMNNYVNKTLYNHLGQLTHNETQKDNQIIAKSVNTYEEGLRNPKLTSIDSQWKDNSVQRQSFSYDPTYGYLSGTKSGTNDDWISKSQRLNFTKLATDVSTEYTSSNNDASSDYNIANYNNQTLANAVSTSVIPTTAAEIKPTSTVSYWKKCSSESNEIAYIQEINTASTSTANHTKSGVRCYNQKGLLFYASNGSNLHTFYSYYPNTLLKSTAICETGTCKNGRQLANATYYFYRGSQSIIQTPRKRIVLEQPQNDQIRKKIYYAYLERKENPSSYKSYAYSGTRIFSTDTYHPKGSSNAGLLQKRQFSISLTANIDRRLYSHPLQFEIGYNYDAEGVLTGITYPHPSGHPMIGSPYLSGGFSETKARLVWDDDKGLSEVAIHFLNLKNNGLPRYIDVFKNFGRTKVDDHTNAFSQGFGYAKFWNISRETATTNYSFENFDSTTANHVQEYVQLKNGNKTTGYKTYVSPWPWDAQKREMGAYIPGDLHKESFSNLPEGASTYEFDRYMRPTVQTYKWLKTSSTDACGKSGYTQTKTQTYGFDTQGNFSTTKTSQYADPACFSVVNVVAGHLSQSFDDAGLGVVSTPTHPRIIIDTADLRSNMRTAPETEKITKYNKFGETKTIDFQRIGGTDSVEYSFARASIDGTLNNITPKFRGFGGLRHNHNGKTTVTRTGPLTTNVTSSLFAEDVPEWQITRDVDNQLHSVSKVKKDGTIIKNSINAKLYSFAGVRVAVQDIKSANCHWQRLSVKLPENITWTRYHRLSCPNDQQQLNPTNDTHMTILLPSSTPYQRTAVKLSGKNQDCDTQMSRRISDCIREAQIYTQTYNNKNELIAAYGYGRNNQLNYQLRLINVDGFRFYVIPPETDSQMPTITQRSVDNIALEQIVSGQSSGNPNCIQSPSDSMSFCENKVTAPDNLAIKQEL